MSTKRNCDKCNNEILRSFQGKCIVLHGRSFPKVGQIDFKVEAATAVTDGHLCEKCLAEEVEFAAGQKLQEIAAKYK